MVGGGAIARVLPGRMSSSQTREKKEMMPAGNVEAFLQPPRWSGTIRFAVAAIP